MPSLLDSKEPESLSILFPKFPKTSEIQLDRFLEFPFIPNGLVSRLIVRTLTLYPLQADSMPIFWARGILVQYSTCYILVRQDLTQISLIVRTSDKKVVESVFCSLTEAANNLLAKWPNLCVFRSSSCSSCVTLHKVTETSSNQQEQ
eukprot:TRINITY_DN14179_c0_g1_i2.p1 TRINITY_DN14179_c0_g1~~TRINITY_DN14179_c0_g1_i2.p1  ORF type:complete len:147 (-),score=22.72 TRINITY_DN14179_c0_g1_i2:163-603(-)